MPPCFVVHRPPWVTVVHRVTVLLLCIDTPAPVAGSNHHNFGPYFPRWTDLTSVFGDTLFPITKVVHRVVPLSILPFYACRTHRYTAASNHVLSAMSAAPTDCPASGRLHSASSQSGHQKKKRKTTSLAWQYIREVEREGKFWNRCLKNVSTSLVCTHLLPS